MLDIELIKTAAKDAGFTLCGVTPVTTFESNRGYFAQWIDSGQVSEVPYMVNYQSLRFDATTLLEGARTAVVCAMNYKSEVSLKQCGDSKIASYALFRDYHKSIRKRLRMVLTSLQQSNPSLRGRACVDSAPILEKQYAVNAGLGWIGRNSLLVTPRNGSFVLLGVLLLDIEANSYDTPLEGVGCGECRRCVDNCPTSAITPTSSPLYNTIDSGKCISALTVESDNSQKHPLHGWIFGCDVCQSCCPYNHIAPMSSDSEFKPLFTPPSAQQWGDISEEEFSAKFAGTPLKRAGLSRLKSVNKLNNC